MFKNPPKSLVPEFEEKTIAMLMDSYQDRMRAVTHLLEEDYLKNSDVGEA